MTSPTELANDLHAQVLELQGQVDALSVELAESEAVIAKVRGLRRYVNARKREHCDRWNDTDDRCEADRCGIYADVLDRLDGIDGL